MLAPWPSPFRRWANENYELLPWFGPAVALSYTGTMRALGLEVYVSGSVVLLGIGFCAVRTKRVKARVAQGILFVFVWLLWGLVASGPWF